MPVKIYFGKFCNNVYFRSSRAGSSRRPERSSEKKDRRRTRSRSQSENRERKRDKRSERTDSSRNDRTDRLEIIPQSIVQFIPQSIPQFIPQSTHQYLVFNSRTSKHIYSVANYYIATENGIGKATFCNIIKNAQKCIMMFLGQIFLFLEKKISDLSYIIKICIVSPTRGVEANTDVRKK